MDSTAVFPPHDIRNTWRMQEMKKAEYLEKIMEMLGNCEDLELIDLIYQTLQHFGLTL